jgi:D-alanine-D-alanine ligase
VLSAIDRSLYEPVVIGITQSGKWVIIPEGYGLSIKNGVLPVVPESGKPVSVSPEGFAVEGKSLGIEIVFPVLHGPYGEDGTIQGLLEIADIPFVGSGVLASAVAMDKSFAKPIFASHGIATAPGIVVKKSDWQNRSAEIAKEVSALGYPVFVKPARGGSSRGTSKVKNEGDLTAAVLDAFSFDPKIMIEKAIVGSEIECAVLEIDGQPQASIVGKIVIDSKFEFYDFEAKYLDGATDIELPAPITATAADAIRSAAIAAFKALGCSGLARVDFFLTNSGQVIINELNTMPGFTSTSVFPKMWAASGVSYTEVITHLLQSAIARTNGPLGN